MTKDRLNDLESKVTDLNQRMCQIERQQDIVGEQISNISARLLNLNDKVAKERKFLISHLIGIGVGTTLLITIAMILFHILK